MLRGTPVHSRTSALCQEHNWRRWAGYLVVGSYELTHEREYYAIRSSAGLIDVSPLYKYLISGPDGARLLDRVVTRDVSKCRVGQVMYTPWCDNNGKVIDDGTLQRLDENTFRLTAADPNFAWLDDNALGLDVKVEDVSAATAALALQGPRSREILQHVSDAVMSELSYYHLTRIRIGDIPVTVSRTGYTGDLGYEIWVEAEQAEALWDILMEGGRPFGLVPAGMLALDMSRIEAGLLLIEVDFISARQALIESQKSSPFELGLGWTVDLHKAHFVGRRALCVEQGQGPSWQFVGLEIQWQSLERIFARAGLPPQIPSAAWRSSVPVYDGRRQIGYATSGCWSPILKKYIALAHLRANYARPGTNVAVEVTVEHRRERARANVVHTPFYNPTRKRT